MAIINGIVEEARKLLKEDGKFKETEEINQMAINAHTAAWFDIFNYLEFSNIYKPIL
jgi:hypothetical protein